MRKVRILLMTLVFLSSSAIAAGPTDPVWTSGFVLSNGLKVDSSGNVIVSMGQQLVPTSITSKGFPLDSNGYLMVSAPINLSAWCAPGVLPGGSTLAIDWGIVVAANAPYGGTDGGCSASPQPGTGMPVARTCVVQNLQVTSTAGGKDATDAVVSLNVGGSATGITCTLGTGTSCSDTTHTALATNSGSLPATGQLIQVQIVTESSTTVAGITASMNCI
jgi:hypothetical protein